MMGLMAPLLFHSAFPLQYLCLAQWLHLHCIALSVPVVKSFPSPFFLLHTIQYSTLHYCFMDRALNFSRPYPLVKGPHYPPRPRFGPPGCFWCRIWSHLGRCRSPSCLSCSCCRWSRSWSTSPLTCRCALFTKVWTDRQRENAQECAGNPT